MTGDEAPTDRRNEVVCAAEAATSGTFRWHGRSRMTVESC